MTTTTYESFFTRVKNLMSGKGITMKGVTYHAFPIRVCNKCGSIFSEGRCPKTGCNNTADWRKAVCTKSICKSHNAFVFQAKEDPKVFFTFCQKCGKFGIGEGLPEIPSRYTPNVPPPIGSKTKPTQEEIDKHLKK